MDKKLSIEAVYYDVTKNTLMTVCYSSGTITYNGETLKSVNPITSPSEFRKLTKQLSKIGVKYVGTSVF